MVHIPDDDGGEVPAGVRAGRAARRHTADGFAAVDQHEADGRENGEILGNGPAVLLKAHGVVVVGADIIECFALAAYVEENAYRQYMALQIGKPYVFSDAEQQASREKLWTPSLFKKTWDHYRVETVGPTLRWASTSKKVR